MKIGLLVIATQNYVTLAAGLIASARQYFMANTGHEVTIFLFTDQKPDFDGVVSLPIKHAPWPEIALKKYNIFDQYREQLSCMDYLFFCDADMKFVSSVGDEILHDLVAVQHPAFYNKPSENYPFENRRESAAYVRPEDRRIYACGAFNGGKADQFLEMASEIKKNVNRDLRRFICAHWHDESHLNWYLAGNPPTLALPPAYCFPEDSNLPFDPKILALNKDHAQFRKRSWNLFWLIVKLRRRITLLFRKIARHT